METINRDAATAATTPISINYKKQLSGDKGIMENKGYRLVLMTERDRNDAIAFLKKFFFHDEPLNIVVGLLDEPGSTCKELEEYCADSISEGLSIMALTPTDDIIAVCINGAVTRENNKVSDMTEQVNACENKKFKKILKLLTNINIEADVFGKFPEINSFFEIRVLSVDDAYRGKGIAKACIERSRVLAKEKGFDLLKIDCSSHYSAMAIANLGGYTCIYKLNYSDYLDEDGKPVFVPDPPHECVKTYVCNLK